MSQEGHFVRYLACMTNVVGHVREGEMIYARVFSALVHVRLTWELGELGGYKNGRVSLCSGDLEEQSRAAYSIIIWKR